jgi:hypothetical protein
MGEKVNGCRIFVGNPEGNSPLGRPRRRWVDNIRCVAWCGFIWLRSGTSGGHLCTRQWAFRLHITCWEVAEWLRNWQLVKKGSVLHLPADYKPCLLLCLISVFLVNTPFFFPFSSCRRNDMHLVTMMQFNCRAAIPPPPPPCHVTSPCIITRLWARVGQTAKCISLQRPHLIALPWRGLYVLQNEEKILARHTVSFLTPI